jgi:hypothetical protein
VVEQVGNADYYDVICEEGRIMLTPVHPGAAAAVRSRLAELGIWESARRMWLTPCAGLARNEPGGARHQRAGVGVAV